jgi:hypothetical protein
MQRPYAFDPQESVCATGDIALSKPTNSKPTWGRSGVALGLAGAVTCTIMAAMFMSDPTSDSLDEQCVLAPVSDNPADPAQTPSPLVPVARGLSGTLPAGAQYLDMGVTLVEMNRAIAQSQGIGNSSGGYVVSVMTGSAAERAGIQPGDVINRINGR